MDYSSLYTTLQEGLSKATPAFFYEGGRIMRRNFVSQATWLLPGIKQHRCLIHECTFQDEPPFCNEVGTLDGNLHIQDVCVKTNQQFPFYIMQHGEARPAQKVLFLFHGFNEKSWDKYLPWGYELAKETGATIVFFPIAFHMERAPADWSEKRHMYALSKERQKRFPAVRGASLSNVAISMRLHAMPQRFIWSGLQTFYDVVHFIKSCKSGAYAEISPDFSYDLFAYSIGGMLAQILKLSNPEGLFTHSKVALFCSGAVFDRLSPVSKFILDSEVKVALFYFLVEHLDSYMKEDERLAHFLSEKHPEGRVFHSMLGFQNKRQEREAMFKKVAKQFYAISLKGDTVIPTFEIMSTLQGAFRDIPVKMEELDYPFSYSHENPFPVGKAEPELLDKAFRETFSKFSAFFCS